LLPIVMAANIGGTATLIGDPPNIMVGSAAHLSFTDFQINVTPPVLVMMVGLDILARRRFAATLRRNAALDAAADTMPPITNRPLLIGMVWIGAAVLVRFLSHGFTGMPAAVPAVVGAAAALVLQGGDRARDRVAHAGVLRAALHPGRCGGRYRTDRRPRPRPGTRHPRGA